MKSIFSTSKILLIAILLISSCGIIAAADDGAIIITNADIVDVVNGKILPNHSVRIEQGIITAIGKTGTIKKQRGDKEIDAAGKYLMPGLVDIHIHLDDAPDDLTLFLNYGVTTIRSLEGTPDHVAWKNAVASGELDGPTVFTSGPILYGSRGDFDGEIWKSSSNVTEAAKKIVEKHIETGYDAVKVYYQLTAEQYDALVIAAKDARLPIVGHVPYSKTITEIIEAGQVTNEHFSGFDTEMVRSESEAANTRTAWGNVLRLTEIDDAKTEKFLRGMHKYRGKHWITPTAIIYEVFTRPDFVNGMLADEKMMGMLSPNKREKWTVFNRFQVPHFDSQSAEDKKVMLAAIMKRREWIKTFHDAGVGIALGTDGGGRWAYPGLSSQQEVEIYVMSGLTPVEALRTATVNAAAALGQEKVFGQIAPGFRADFNLVGENPLEDIRAIRDIHGVMTRGKWYSRKDLNSKLDALYNKRKVEAKTQSKK